MSSSSIHVNAHNATINIQGSVKSIHSSDKNQSSLQRVEFIKQHDDYILNVDLDQCGFKYADGIKKVIMDDNNDLTEDDFPELIDYSFVESKWPTLRTLEDYTKVHVKGVERGFFATLEQYDGFADTLNMLRDNGVVVRIVTNRLFTGANYAKSVADTMYALENIGATYDEICFVKRKSDIHGDALVDDSPTNIVEWANAQHSKIFIFDHPYNRDLDGDRVYNWKEIGEKVLAHKKSIGK